MDLEVKYNLFMAPDGYWRLQAWVSRCGDDDDPNVFVYQALPPVSDSPDAPSSIFVDVANRLDMEEYPADNPREPLSFYRKKSMDVSLTDSSEMMHAVSLIEKNLESLARAYGKVG